MENIVVGMILEKTIAQEKNPKLKAALQYLDDYLFNWWSIRVLCRYLSEDGSGSKNIIVGKGQNFRNVNFLKIFL